MKKYIGITAFFGITLTYIWGINLFIPKPKQPTEGIPHNYYHPDVWGNDTIIQDTIPIDDNIELEMNCGDTIIVKATMYNAVLEQCDDTPDKTADQSKIPNVDSCSHLNWLAVSQDLLWFNDGPIRYGDTVYVIAGHKTGYYIVRDAMNKRWTNRIDFLESTGVEAYRYNEAELIINS
jgi:3D (Asp-Asp-Asp) domain-containing protein